MKPDDEVCYCYHVSLRKLVNFSRRKRPKPPSRMTECLNAGTGCGWCIPFLIKIANDPNAFAAEDLSPGKYAQKRREYIDSGQARNTFSDTDDRES
jgi:bacterioferritin-associated ferredoxin